MLSKTDYNLRKSALKRQYQEALQSVDTSGLMANPFVAEGIQKMEAKKALTGRGLYEGRGAYSGMKFLKDIRKAGRILGTNKITTGLMNRFAGQGMYSGRGAYGNEVMSGSELRSPTIDAVGDETGSIIISNREYVGDIYGPSSSGAFNVTSFPLNPGLEQTFPWLAQIAANYEEYEMIQLVFEFASSIQDVNSSNGQVGTIICATNYNASQPAFTDKPTMAAYYGSQSSKTTDDLVHGVECDPAKLSGVQGHYVRVNPVLTGESLKEYDHGLFQLATHNIPTSMLNGTLGELYVTYKVLLRKPKFLTGRGLAISRALFVSGAGTEATTLIMGTDAGLLKGQQNNLNVAVVLTANTIKLTFPAYYAGTVAVSIFVEGTSLTGSILSSTTGIASTGQVTFVSDIYGTQSTSSSDLPTAQMKCDSATQCVYVFHAKLQPATNATDNTITLTTAITAGTIVQGQMDIVEYNTSFNDVNGRPVLVNTAGTVVVPS
jgi:hypothetical protein